MNAAHPTQPPEDRELSPYTGWTRAHWESAADRLLDALVPYASEGGGLYRLPGRASRSGRHSDGLEGYARSFLLAAFRVAGAGGGAGDPRVSALLERYARGLAAGTDPAAADAWPPITERSQPMVEAASIAVGLHETRAWLWDRLEEPVRERVVDWLSEFIGLHPVDNNWRLFQVVVEEFLASVGADHRRAEIDGGLDRIEDWYAGGGWYTDGDGRSFDHYNGWALHFYPLLWARIAGPGADPARVDRYRERLRTFLGGFRHFFGADGAPMHQGRSLTYRFAAAAPVWMGALADATDLPPGLTRRLASGAVRHFAERGAPDGEGLLRLGWYAPYLPVTQTYSGPASPYWASKAFVGLLVPASHPAWTRTELPSPVEESDTYCALPGPGWLLHGTRADGIVRLLNHGSDRYVPRDPEAPDDPHYTKLAYSTRTAPRTGGRGSDGDLALVAADGSASRRTVVRPLGAAGRWAASGHDAVLPGDPRRYEVVTTALAHGPCEVRVHRIAAPDGFAPGVTVRDGGWAVAGAEPPAAERGAGWALARRADGLTSAVADLLGGRSAGVERAVDANAFGPASAAPYLVAEPAGGAALYVSLVVLTGEPLDAGGFARLRGTVAVAAGGGGVRVRFADGTEYLVAADGVVAAPGTER